MTYGMEEQASMFDQDTCSGRTSQEHSAQTKEQTSKPSSKKRSASSNQKPPLCLCLRTDGLQADASTPIWENGVLLGEYSTHSFGECPKEEKRIALIIDFGGMSAPEILFERKSMRWNTEKSGTARQEIANDLGKSFDVAVFDARGNGDGKTVCTITGDHESRITDYTAICVGNGQVNSALDMTFDVCQTLNCMHDPMAILHKGFVRRLTPLECERLQGFEDGWTDIGEWVDTKGKRHKESSDAARYKAIGNSIALPPWKYILKRISAQYERNATLGSLFDGIGGFPFLWEQINGKGSARWASEIEEFPIAVTRYHFGDS